VFLTNISKTTVVHFLEQIMKAQMSEKRISVSKFLTYTTDDNFFKHTLRQTSSYDRWFMAGECNPHCSTTTLANLEITSLWRHWWRRKSETIRDRQKRRPPHPMKSSLDNFCKTGNYVIYGVIIWVQDGNCKKWLERILVLVRSTI